MLSFLSLSVNPNSTADRLDESARRLQALLQAGADDAILHGRSVGFDLTADGYRFVMLKDDGWQPMAGDTPLRARQLEPGITLAVIARDDDQPRLAGGSDEDEDDDQAVRPEAVMLSSGEIVPFELELYATDVDHRYRLSGEANGDITRERIEGPR